ncbi:MULTISPECIES: aminodeoxychorismate/anthranilate synthase component II [unclassified Salinivibrio]|uniref:anthranilate synthase component II n=1 Tax=unclassified Salinivibrio TaxID=2636825 RepID=UPI000986B54E|nr:MULTISPECIES: aminodeoxychorismate/anthranilate synthase component II [unclassified Salinivibrio]MPS32713.1 aminodeoxychorismate/anthranilate synthase component II [Salinivibrio sp. VYel7]MPX90745.1 aminodeoxychorismate/anthranilate synthase component II [Salinivibrio sp. VYel1]MPX94103.1 aminodeoxychorismate/anthranilate synthase component II [Salinivibrio sp. VYel9]MPX96811.1 aminodeoxychorismate/anthranilate synthase component II [Salinivibrio sp. VYel6]MPY00037.1 aminodeoxychorismate/an
MLLIIDNYDSFTYNLYQYFCELGVSVCVKRNDAISLAEIEAMAPTHIVVSPGPCTPDEAGISLAVIEHFAGKIPLLGVCLGYQALAQVFGAKVIRARAVMHGKTSPVDHEGQGVFAHLPSPLTVTRYHSLVVDPHSLPACLMVTATTTEADGREIIMGLKHRELAVEGVQFHPESILTQEGHALLANFLQQ